MTFADGGNVRVFSNHLQQFLPLTIPKGVRYRYGEHRLFIHARQCSVYNLGILRAILASLIARSKTSSASSAAIFFSNAAKRCDDGGWVENLSFCRGILVSISPIYSKR